MRNKRLLIYSGAALLAIITTFWLLYLILHLRQASQPIAPANSKPEIATALVDDHAAIVNKHIYERDELLTEMEKELGTSLSSQLDPDLLARVNGEALDHAANVSTMAKFSLKLFDLNKEMENELDELRRLIAQYQPNPRLQGLFEQEQAARDKVGGIIDALTEKMKPENH